MKRMTFIARICRCHPASQPASFEWGKKAREENERKMPSHWFGIYHNALVDRQGNNYYMHTPHRDITRRSPNKMALATEAGKNRLGFKS